MMTLKHRLPYANDYLSNKGLHGLLSGKPFTNVPMYQMIEMKINRTLKKWEIRNHEKPKGKREDANKPYFIFIKS